MSNKIKLHNLTFEPYISKEEIDIIIEELAVKLADALEDKIENTVMLIVMNGSLFFAADIIRKLPIPVRMDTIQTSSYTGTQQSGTVNIFYEAKEDLTNKHIIILEDIVDTGLTLQRLITFLQPFNPASIEIASLLYKPDAYRGTLPIKLVGREIPNVFVVGYGMDYDGLGRNLPEIYIKSK